MLATALCSQVKVPTGLRVAADQFFCDARAMTKDFLRLLSVALLSGMVCSCSHTRFSEYTGKRSNMFWPVSKGTMAETTFSVPVYRGWPEKPYEVIGSVRFDEPRKYWDDGIISMVASAGKRHKGDAIIIRQGAEFGVAKLTGMVNPALAVSQNQTTALVIRWLSSNELQTLQEQKQQFLALCRREYPNVNEDVEEMLLQYLLRESTVEPYAQEMSRQFGDALERINKKAGDVLSGTWAFKGILNTSSLASSVDEEILLGLATVKVEGENIAILSNSGRVEINFTGSLLKGRVQGQLGIGSFSSKCDGAALDNKISLSFQAFTPDGTVRGNLVFQR